MKLSLSSPLFCLFAASALLHSAEPATERAWKIGTPIVTYWCGPSLTDAAARQMAEGGWNLVWCNEKELEVAQRHGLRGQLQDALLTPASLDDPQQREKLDALIARVRQHPALYSYFITDEPGAGQFPALGKLVTYLRERDPAHLAYINLFPTYATQEQLGTKGKTVTAYNEHLRQFIEGVKPALMSYDHYHFAVDGDRTHYFLNLALIRRAALDAGFPFLNIVQASSWAADMRVPTGDEMRFLVYTTLAYGGQGISYYIYTCANHKGGIANADGTPTALYKPLKSLNREFVAIASELQPLRSVGVYHGGMLPRGTERLPGDIALRLDPPVQDITYKALQRVKGVVLGYFATPSRGTDSPSHVLVVNLDYKKPMTTSIHGPAQLELFNATTGQWNAANANHTELRLPGGGGKLVRLRE